MPRIKAFEDNVDEYEAWFENHRLAYESELQAIRLLLPNGEEGLEVGVGTGRFAAPLGITVGIEPCSAMGQLAIDRGIDVRFGVGENLPCEDSSFGFVLLVTTLCFLDDVSSTLAEVYRVLKPGGHIVIALIDRESPLGECYEKHKKDNVFYRDATFLSTDEVVTHLKKSGFSDFIFHQTICQNPEEMKEVEVAKSGYGEGLFVVVKGTKTLISQGDSSPNH